MTIKRDTTGGSLLAMNDADGYIMDLKLDTVTFDGNNADNKSFYPENGQIIGKHDI
jgi:hypothetical protein